MFGGTFYIMSLCIKNYNISGHILSLLLYLLVGSFAYCNQYNQVKNISKDMNSDVNLLGYHNTIRKCLLVIFLVLFAAFFLLKILEKTLSINICYKIVSSIFYFFITALFLIYLLKINSFWKTYQKNET